MIKDFLKKVGIVLLFNMVCVPFFVFPLHAQAGEKLIIFHVRVPFHSFQGDGQGVQPPLFRCGGVAGGGRFADERQKDQ